MDPFLRRKVERAAEVNRYSISQVVSLCLKQALPGIVEHGLIIRPIEDPRFGYENLGCLAPQEADVSVTRKYGKGGNDAEKPKDKNFDEAVSAQNKPDAPAAIEGD